jgi:ribosomal protein L18
VKVNGNQAVVELAGISAEEGGALHGLARSLVNNAVTGVTQGFKKELEIVGLGYRAQVAGDKLTLQLGFAHPVEFKMPSGIKAAVDSKQTLISITGMSRYQVGEVAAQSKFGVCGDRSLIKERGSGILVNISLRKPAKRPRVRQEPLAGQRNKQEATVQGIVLERYQFRKARTRDKIRELQTSRPRLCVVRTLQHIYTQVIDDGEGKTLVAASSLSPELQGHMKSSRNKSAAEAVGQLVMRREKPGCNSNGTR